MIRKYMPVALALFCIPFLFSCSKKVAPQQGLVGEYLFNRNSKDQTSFQNHGEVHNASPVKGHKGRAISAYQFNGVDQYISIPSAPQTNFDYNQDFSVSLWVSVDAEQKDLGGPLNDIVRKWRGDTQGYPFAIVYYNPTATDSIRDTFSFVKYDGSICRNSPQLFSPVTKTGEFVHLICIRDGARMKLYLNGVQVSYKEDTNKAAAECGSHNNSEITIGTRAHHVRYFAGAVDDVRFYNRALTPGEIAILFKL